MILAAFQQALRLFREWRARRREQTVGIVTEIKTAWHR